MNKIFIIVFVFTFHIGFSQSVSVLISETTLNGKEFDKSQTFQNSIESVISNLERAPLVVERSRLSELIEIIQDEKNLFRDFGFKDLNKLNPENIDYVIFSNFITSPTSTITNLQIQCIKIRGESILSKFVFPTIQLNNSDMEEMKLFENRIQSVLEKFAFVDKLGVLSNATLKEINEKLDSRQKEIDEVKNQLFAYTEYVDMAELGIDGYGKTRVSAPLIYESDLVNKMKIVISIKKDIISINNNFEAINVIDSVIKDYPRYPFGYYCKAIQLETLGDLKWKFYANKAIEIFKYTTKIKTVNHQHLQALNVLESKLLKY
jgi:hypothetical protein